MLGPAHLFGGVVEQGLGETRLRRGKRDQALTDYQRSLAIIEKALDSKSSRLVASLLGIGRVYNDRHDAGRARAPLERALGIAETQPGDGRELNEVRLALAEALWPSGSESQKARTLAMEARDNLAKLGPRAHRDVVEATAWLHDHH